MSWVGGDIPGILGMGHTLETTPNEMDGIANSLKSSVDKLAGDASWSGHAAENFKRAWTLSSSRIEFIRTAYVELGGILTGLGHDLQSLENQLYDEATRARAKGAQIGDDGKPLPLVITGDPNSPEAVAATNAQRDYEDQYKRILHEAQGKRLTAAANIQGITTAFEPPEGDEKFPWDKATTVGAVVKGLYLIPQAKKDEAVKKLPAELSALRDQLRNARKDLRAAKKSYDAAGLKLPKDNPARLNHSQTVKDIKATDAALNAALDSSGKAKVDKILGATLTDAAKWAHPGAELARLPKGLKFLGEVPVIDLAAGGLIGHLQTVDDTEKGWSVQTARTNDYGAQALGVLGGAAVIAAAPVEAPVALVVGGAAIVAWGVGDFGYSVTHQHWSESIHDRGVVSGVWHTSMNTFSDTGKAMKDDVVDVGKAIGGLWSKAFG